MHCNENPLWTPALRSEELMSNYNFLLSYHLDSDFCCSNMWKPNLSPPVPFQDKWGLVYWASSHCEPARTTYIYSLMKYIKIDAYGKCLHNKDDPKGIYGRSNGKVSRFYKFQLVLLNGDCDYWMDEKLAVALDAGTVPIVMATNKMDQLLPGRLRQSVILFRDFETPKKLADYLLYLSNNPTEYNKYLEWKEAGFNMPSSYYDSCLGMFWDSRYKLYCRICMELARGNKGHNGLKTLTCPARKLRDWIKDDAAYNEALQYAKNESFAATV